MKKAFTLAEVLITLGIIGVVAAMTIPTLISNYQKKTAVTRLKQTYAQITTAVEKVANDNGVVGFGGWQCDKEGDMDYYQEGCIHDAMKLIALKMYPHPASWEQAACYEGTPYKPYHWLNPAANWVPNANQLFSAASWSAQLKNGACVVWHQYAWAGDARGSLVIDIDGSYNGPNVVGKDTFVFIYLSADKGYGFGPSGRMIIPEGAYSLDKTTNPVTLTESKSRNTIKANCKRDNTGKQCAALIMLDGWQILSDYPW